MKDLCDKEIVALWYYNNFGIEYVLDGGKNNADNITNYDAYDEAFTLKDPTKDPALVVNGYQTAVFEAEEGSAIKQGGVDYYTNGKIRVDRTATRYAFDGWFTEPEFENKV